MLPWLVLSILLGLFLVSLAVSTAFLWLSCRWARVAGVTWKRALAAALVLWLVGLALNATALIPTLAGQRFYSPLLTLTAVLILWGVFWIFTRASLGKAFVVGLIWFGLNVAYAVVVVLVTSQTLTEGLINPTGAMAETVWGYQKLATCPQCGYAFPVNCSDEAEGKPPAAIAGCTCPNCRFAINFSQAGKSLPCSSGDRFLMARSFLTGSPAHLDLVVFAYPATPEPKGVPIRYLKRVVGLPGETIGIYGGKLYTLPADKRPKALEHPEDQREDPGIRWQMRFLHEGEANDLLLRSDTPFEIIRKPPAQILALRRLVYDHDHQPQDLKGVSSPRWTPEADHPEVWVPDGPAGFRHASAGDQIGWLRYRHVLRQGPEPELITDFLGYNTGAYPDLAGGVEHRTPALNWVGDLMLECQVTVDQPTGELVLELAKGADRFQARWQLASGACTLQRLADGKAVDLASQPTGLNRPGTFQVRFANVDDRLTVWVDERLPFGDGVVYPAPAARGPVANDLQPASIGARGPGVRIQHLKLWRDTNFHGFGYAPGRRRSHARDPGQICSGGRNATTASSAVERAGPVGRAAGLAVRHLVRPAGPLLLPGGQQPPKLRQPQRGPGAPAPPPG